MAGYSGRVPSSPWLRDSSATNIGPTYRRKCAESNTKGKVLLQVDNKARMFSLT